MRRALWFLAVASALVATTATAQKAFLPSMGGGDVTMPVNTTSVAVRPPSPRY
jgi:hypothetical protein